MKLRKKVRFYKNKFKVRRLGAEKRGDDIVLEHTGEWTNHVTPDQEEHEDKCVKEKVEKPSESRNELDKQVVT